LFAVLLNCPYPDPPVSACFFPSSFTPWWGEGRPRGSFVAGHSQTITINHLKIEAESKQDELVAQESRPSPEVCPLSSSVYLFKSVSPTSKASTRAMCSVPMFPEDYFKGLFLT